jgi:hypothetical protein
MGKRLNHEPPAVTAKLGWPPNNALHLATARTKESAVASELS